MRKIATLLLAAAGVFVFGSALADLTVKDGGGVTRTLKNFVCETTKLCSATVLIKSDGTEIGTSSAEVFVGGRGTAGSAAGGVLTVQGSASGTAVPVSLASVPSHAVTNAGTFAVQSNGFTSWAGGTLGAMATYGTSPGAVNVPGVNAYVTNTLAAVGNNADDVAAGAGAGSPVVNYNYVWDGTNWDRAPKAVLNPCESIAQSYAPISITTATTTRIVTPSASNKTYICGLILVTAAANNVGIVEGTGGTCGSGTAGVIGGTTAANGPNYSANGGMVLQAGKTAHAQTAGTNVDLCLITSAATPLAGGIKYVQAP